MRKDANEPPSFTVRGNATQCITLTPINSISKAYFVANSEVKSGTNRNSLGCEEKGKNSGGDSKFHGRTLTF